MPRLMLALFATAAAAIGAACHSYSSAGAGSELLGVALATADAAASTDCDPPRTSFHPIGAPGAARSLAASSRLTAVALVYRQAPPRRPYAVLGAVRASVPRDSLCLTDLTQEIRGRAAAEGCDAVLVDARERTSADERISLAGSCLVFSR